MKKAIFVLSVFSFLYLPILSAQEKPTSYKGENVIELDSLPANAVPEVRKVVANRALSVNFFESTILFAEPSIISFLPLGITYNLDRNLQKKMFILDADIRTPIALGGKKWYWERLELFNAFHVIPRFQVRIFQNDPKFDDRSTPVRTPSYMPTIKYFITQKKLWNTERKTKYFFSVELFHHSNGQDGAEFTKDSIINVYNGNFGENLVFEFAINGSTSNVFDSSTPTEEVPTEYERAERLRTETQTKNLKTTKEKIDVSKSIFWKVGVEWHPKGLTNKVFLEEKMYGRYRLNANLGYIFAPEKRELIYSKEEEAWIAVEDWGPRESVRLLANISYILDGSYYSPPTDNPEKINFFNIEKRLNLEGAVFWRIKGTPSSALFGKISYLGSDPYNIYFQQSLFSIKVGIALNKFLYSTGN